MRRPPDVSTIFPLFSFCCRFKTSAIFFTCLITGNVVKTKSSFCSWNWRRFSAWPTKPKPVMSVLAWPLYLCISFAARWLSVIIDSTAFSYASVISSFVRCSLIFFQFSESSSIQIGAFVASWTPVGFVRIKTSPGCAFVGNMISFFVHTDVATPPMMHHGLMFMLKIVILQFASRADSLNPAMIPLTTSCRSSSSSSDGRLKIIFNSSIFTTPQA